MIQLYSSERRDIYEALEKARIWRNHLTFIFFVLQVVCVVGFAIHLVGVGDWDPMGPPNYILAAGIVYLVWRGSFLFTVYKYTKELETALVAIERALVAVESAAEVGYICLFVFMSLAAMLK